MNKIGVTATLGGAALFLAGAIALGMLFSGHQFHHLTHLTGHKAYPIAIATASAAALPLGIVSILYGMCRINGGNIFKDDSISSRAT